MALCFLSDSEGVVLCGPTTGPSERFRAFRRRADGSLLACAGNDQFCEAVDKACGRTDRWNADEGGDAVFFGKMAVFHFDLNKGFDVFADEGVRVNDNGDFIGGGFL